MKVEVELDELIALRDRVSRLEAELAAQTYKGNSIGYIYDKMTNYGNQVAVLGPWISRWVESGDVVLSRHNDLDLQVAQVLGLGVE